MQYMPNIKSSQIQVILLFIIFISFYLFLEKFTDEFYYKIINIDKLEKRQH